MKTKTEVRSLTEANGAQLIHVRSGLNYSNDISGTFILHRPFVADPNAKRDGFVWVHVDGKNRRLDVYLRDIQIGAARQLTKDDIVNLEKTIADRYETMDMLVNAAVDGELKAVIVVGAPGVGKSYTVLKAIEKKKKINPRFSVAIMRGFSSALGLYQQLYMFREKGSVLFLDDIDSIFSDEAGINLLKGALDTTGDRRVGWYTDNNVLRQNDIPNDFVFHGTVIVLSNIDFDAVMRSGSKIAPTLKAVLDRCTYLNLKVHSNDEIMIRIKQLTKIGKLVDPKHADTILSWVETNKDHLRTLSLRTLLQLQKLIELYPDQWKKIAENTMLVNR